MDAHMIEPRCLTEGPLIAAGVRFRRASLGLENGFAGVAGMFCQKRAGLIRRASHRPATNRVAGQFDYGRVPDWKTG